MDVSVITTLYNYRNYIADAIQSFLSQDLTNSEMIIVDDCSTDNPLTVIQPFLSDRVKYIRLDTNMGYSHAKNVGIRASRAEVLVMLDADDMLTKHSLSARYRKINEGFDMVHGPALDLVNGKTSPSPLWKKWIKSDKGPSAYKHVHAQTVMLRKEIHRRVGLYDTSLRFKSDREMWARVFNHGFKISYIKDYVCTYRIHSKQMHKSKAKSQINDALQQEVLRKIAHRSKVVNDVEMLT